MTIPGGLASSVLWACEAGSVLADAPPALRERRRGLWPGGVADREGASPVHRHACMCTLTSFSLAPPPPPLLRPLQVVLVAEYARKEGLKNCLGLVGILQRRATVLTLTLT